MIYNTSFYQRLGSRYDPDHDGNPSQAPGAPWFVTPDWTAQPRAHPSQSPSPHSPTELSATPTGALRRRSSSGSPSPARRRRLASPAPPHAARGARPPFPAVPADPDDANLADHGGWLASHTSLPPFRPSIARQRRAALPLPDRDPRTHDCPFAEHDMMRAEAPHRRLWAQRLPNPRFTAPHWRELNMPCHTVTIAPDPTDRLRASPFRLLELPAEIRAPILALALPAPQWVNAPTLRYDAALRTGRLMWFVGEGSREVRWRPCWRTQSLSETLRGVGLDTRTHPMRCHRHMPHLPLGTVDRSWLERGRWCMARSECYGIEIDLFFVCRQMYVGIIPVFRGTRLTDIATRRRAPSSTAPWCSTSAGPWTWSWPAS